MWETRGFSRLIVEEHSPSEQGSHDNKRLEQFLPLRVLWMLGATNSFSSLLREAMNYILDAVPKSGTYKENFSYITRTIKKREQWIQDAARLPFSTPVV